jgi:hypothetical protein
VLDTNDVYRVAVLVHAADDPIGTAAPRKVARQLTSRRFTHAARVITKRPRAERPDLESDVEGQLLLEGTANGAGKA